MKHRLPWLKPTTWWSVLWLSVLVTLTIFVCARNYTPNTWLTGWDTLHPEFNFSLNFSRLFWGSWRNDQGLGAVPAHAHMSELPRLFILWLGSFVFPLSFLRYIYIFVCLILGPIGIFFFAQYIFSRTVKSKPEVISLASFTAGLLYLFNLGTVQHFYVVFEMFAVQYAALGWLFLFATQVVEKLTKKSWFLFFVISLLATPMAYASTLWFAYFAGLLLYLGSIFLFTRTKEMFLRCTYISFLSLFANAFWLFPNLYFLLSGASKTVLASQTNQLFSPEAFIQNQEFGTLRDIPLLRNFLFNWLHVKDGHYQQLLIAWQNHLKNPIILAIGYLVFIISVLGSVTGVLKKQKYIISLLPVFFLTLFMLINANPPFTAIFLWLRDHSSLFEEGLRFPFTKFSLLFMLCYSVFFGYFTLHMTQWLIKQLSHTFVILAIVGSVWLVILPTLCWPMFKGELISSSLRISIPSQYFEFFSWANTLPRDARFATLPAHSKFGWEYFNWGYEGAGFLWFGIPQPLLVRDFDRWNSGNETFYLQYSDALYSQNAEQLSDVLSAFDVTFILIDRSATVPEQNSDVFQFSQQEQLLQSIGAEQIWSKDFLSVYTIPSHNTSDATAVSQSESYIYKQPIYSNFKNFYETIKEPHTSVYFPFLHVIKDRITPSISYKSSNIPGTAHIEFSQNLQKSEKDTQLVLPSFNPGQSYQTVAEISYINNEFKVIYHNPYQVLVGSENIPLSPLPPVSIQTASPLNGVIAQINDNTISVGQGEVIIDVIHLNVGDPILVSLFEINQREKIATQQLSNSFYKCWTSTSEDNSIVIEKSSIDSTSVTTKNAIACANIPISPMPKSGLLLSKLNYVSVFGAKPQICISTGDNDPRCEQNSVHDPASKDIQTVTLSENISESTEYTLHIYSPEIDTADTSLQEIRFSEPEVFFYPLIGRYTANKDIWSNILTTQKFEIKKNTQESMTLSAFTVPKNIDLNSSSISFGNCDIQKRGTFSKKFESDKTIFYADSNGAACQGQKIPNISSMSDFILRMQGKNDFGRSIKVYVTNLGNYHLDLEKLLPSNQFDESFTITSKEFLSESGYSLNLL